jgi:hypothetical protein
MASVTRMNFNMDTELAKQVDAYAASMHINRTAAISVLVSQALQGLKVGDALAELSAQIKLAREQGSIDG